MITNFTPEQIAHFWDRAEAYGQKVSEERWPSDDFNRALCAWAEASAEFRRLIGAVA